MGSYQLKDHTAVASKEDKGKTAKSNQSDVATLTRGIRFRAGFCTYYRAGTTYCIHTGWKIPPPSTSPITFRIRLTWLHAEFFLGVALFVLAVANVIIFFVRNLTNSSGPEEPRAVASAAISPNPAPPARIRARDLYVLIFGCLFCMLKYCARNLRKVEIHTPLFTGRKRLQPTLRPTRLSSRRINIRRAFGELRWSATGRAAPPLSGLRLRCPKTWPKQGDTTQLAFAHSLHKGGGDFKFAHLLHTPF